MLCNILIKKKVLADVRAKFFLKPVVVRFALHLFQNANTSVVHLRLDGPKLCTNPWDLSGVKSILEIYDNAASQENELKCLGQQNN